MPAPAPTVPVETPVTAPEVKPVVAATPEKPADADYPGKGLGLQPIEAPSIPVTPDVEAQLQDLLAKYRADQITPAEYQAARAKILGGP